MKVFVYGTLRKGLAWHSLIKNSEFIGEAKTKDKYCLYAENIPFLFKDEEVSKIKGEVYEVDELTLKNLDKLEGHPNWYYREEVSIILNTEKEIIAWVYFYPKPCGKKIISGDFLDYISSNISN